MTCYAAFVHQCSPSRPSSALCEPPAGRWRSIRRRITAGGQLRRHGREIVAQSLCRNVPLPKIQREEMRFLTPAEIGELAEAIYPRYRARRPADRGAGGLIAGPPKTRAGRRTVGLPPFVVRELEAHLAAAQRPGSHVFTAAGGGRCWSRAFGRAGPAHPRPYPHRRGGVDAVGATLKEVRPCARGTPRSTSPWTSAATRRSLAGRGGPVPSSRGLDYGVRQHGRKPQDARSPG